VRFIKLTNAMSAEPVYVAVEHVVCVSSYRLGFWANARRTTLVQLVGGRHVVVGEPLEVVMAALGVDAGKTIDDLS
jgi:hypothetical protein